jgi:hypothetical protein
MKSDLAAELILEAAKDFSKRRAELWRDVHLEHMTVHEIGEHRADVTEGNPWPLMGVVWERLHYDWSSGHSVEGVVVDSNIFKPGSTWGIWVRPHESGSLVEVKATRRLKGRGLLLAPFFPTGLAKRDVEDYLKRFLDRIAAEQAK